MHCSVIEPDERETKIKHYNNKTNIMHAKVFLSRRDKSKSESTHSTMHASHITTKTNGRSHSVNPIALHHIV